MTTTGSSRREHREYIGALLSTIGGAAALLASTGQTWASGRVTLPPPLAPAPVALTGSDIAPAAAAMGWAGLAALAALVATRGWPRRATGVPIVAFGAVALYDVWRGTRPGELARLASEQATVDGRLTGPALAAPWPLLAVAGALILAVAGMLTIARGGAWPGMGGRYDRHSAAHPDRSGDPAELWKSLDSGADPTRDPTPGSAAEARVGDARKDDTKEP